MGYLRLWRRKTIVPGLRMNLSKSGLSWSLGPRGAHFTVGPHGTRRTIGIPGTGVFYTSYSGYHAHRATRQRSAPTSAAQQAATQTPRPPVLVHTDPMLPTTKIVLGVVLAVIGVLTILAYVGIGFLVAGAVLIAVGLAQRNKPEWKVECASLLPRGKPGMRARVFYEDGARNAYRLAAELEAEDADDVWRALEAEPDRAGRRMAPGDVVYIGDLYFQLDGDGGWRPVKPGKLTRHLYGLIT